jgi:DNA-binding protein HU-beta
MTKADIVDKVAAGTGLTKLETEAIIEGFFKTVIEALKNGKGIEIRGFGSYKVKKKNARLARNPKTGEQVSVPEHYVPTFKFSKDFKKLVDEGMKVKESRSNENNDNIDDE